MITPILDFSHLLGTARNQYQRATCLAFASSDFNRYSNAIHEPLSVEYLAHHAVKTIPNWMIGDGLNIPAILNALDNPGQPLEESYPYDPSNAGRPLQSAPSDVGQLYASKVSRQGLSANEIVLAINDQKPVCLVIALSQYFFSPVAGIVVYSNDYLPDALHAVVGVGIGTHSETGEKHIFIRNSWGVSWGLCGHAWLPLSYLETHLHDSFAL
jgi:hypothetical protein